MPYSFYGKIILLALLLFACRSIYDNDKIKVVSDTAERVPPIINIQPQDSVKLQIDSNAIFSAESFSYFEDDSLNAYFIVHNSEPFEGVSELWFFNAVSGALAHKIDLVKHTRAKINDFFVLSLDHIIIYSKERDQFLRLYFYKTDYSEVVWSKTDTSVQFSAYRL